MNGSWFLGCQQLAGSSWGNWWTAVEALFQPAAYHQQTWTTSEQLKGGGGPHGWNLIASILHVIHSFTDDFLQTFLGKEHRTITQFLLWGEELLEKGIGEYSNTGTYSILVLGCSLQGQPCQYWWLIMIVTCHKCN